MSVNFVPNEWLSRGSAVITAPPFTMACWFNVVNITSNYTFMAVSRSGNDYHYHILQCAGGIAGDPVRALSRAGSGSAAGIAETTSGYTANFWYHACGVFAASNDRRAYLNGVNKGTNATDRSPTIDEFYVGRYSGGGYISGSLAEAAIWNIALTDADVLALGGYRCSPLCVRPDALIAYWPLIIYNSTSMEYINKYELTGNGTPTSDDSHPKIIKPTSPVLSRGKKLIASHSLQNPIAVGLSESEIKEIYRNNSNTGSFVNSVSKQINFSRSLDQNIVTGLNVGKDHDRFANRLFNAGSRFPDPFFKAGFLRESRRFPAGILQNGN